MKPLYKIMHKYLLQHDRPTDKIYIYQIPFGKEILHREFQLTNLNGSREICVFLIPFLTIGGTNRCTNFLNHIVAVNHFSTIKLLLNVDNLEI